MQFLHPENNFFSGSIVGSNLAIATGVALAMKQQARTASACACSATALNTGSFHEGLNLAAIWKLPVVFVCENNQYAEVRLSRRSAPMWRREEKDPRLIPLAIALETSC